MATFYAQPYAYTSHGGMSFEVDEDTDWTKLKKKLRKKLGDTEYSIEFVDGDQAEIDIWKALRDNTEAGLQDFILVFSETPEFDLPAVYYAIAYNNYTAENAIDWADREGRPFQGNTVAYAEDFIDGIGGISALPEDRIRAYYDYAALGERVADENGLPEEAHDEDGDLIWSEAEVEDYAQELAEDTGTYPEEFFDMESYARDLATEMVEFVFDGADYVIDMA